MLIKLLIVFSKVFESARDKYLCKIYVTDFYRNIYLNDNNCFIFSSVPKTLSGI